MEELRTSNNSIAISVVMGVYNIHDKDVLYSSIHSILDQTFTDFEFIIYNDGSDGDVTEYLKNVSKLDSRIVLMGSDENRGLAFSLNTCIEKAKGKYIARMDGDDISMPTRFAKQLEFMEAHPEYAWCGTNAELINGEGAWGERVMVEEPQEKDFLRFSPFIHPSVMYRAEIFEHTDKYIVSEETLRCEDYEIFMRLYSLGYRGYNIQEKLFKYREEKQSYKKRSMRFRMNEAKIRYRNFKKLHVLFPTGWIYVIRPVIGGFVPNGMISYMKRKESGYRHERENGPKSGVLHKEAAE